MKGTELSSEYWWGQEQETHQIMGTTQAELATIHLPGLHSSSEIVPATKCTQISYSFLFFKLLLSKIAPATKYVVISYAFYSSNYCFILVQIHTEPIHQQFKTTVLEIFDPMIALII